MINIEKGKQIEQVRIDERNRRESERLSRNNLDFELETQEEIMLEYDQSAYNMTSQDFYNTVYVPPEVTSDNSLSETDVEIYSTPLSSQLQSTQ